MANAPESTVSSPDLRERQAEAVAAQLKSIRRELAKWNTGDVLGRHRIGALIAEMIRKRDTYGQKIVPRVARELGFNENWVYDCVMVAETWNATSLGALLKQRDAVRGQPLSWSHLVLLASVVDGRERRRWINHVLAEGLTTRELKAALDADPAADGADEADEVDGEETETDSGGGAELALRWLRHIRAGAEAVLGQQRSWARALAEELDLDERGRAEAEAALAKAQEARDAYDELIDRLTVVVGEPVETR